MAEHHSVTLDRDELWRVCAKLIEHDTISTNSSMPAATYVAEQLDLPGWTVRVHQDHAFGAPKGSVVAFAGPSEPGGLVLSGHLDIVPFANQPGWTRDPLRLTRDGDNIYGRGVADMKGFIAQCVVVARRLSVEALRRPIALIFTSDEEVGCVGSERLVPHFPSLFRGQVMPDRAVIGEPTDFTVYNAHKGHVRCRLRVEGSPGHSSRPDLGLNAIVAAAEVIRAIEDFAATRGRQTTPEHRDSFPEFPEIAFNVGTIEGGCAVNMIPELCELTLGFRPRPGDDAYALIDELKLKVREAIATTHPKASVDLFGTVITPPMHAAPDGEVADALRTLSPQGQFVGAPFATDGGQFEKAGMRSYIWGPGRTDQAHQPNESMSIESFLKMPSMLEALVRRICGS